MLRQQTYYYDVTCVILGGGAGTRLWPLTYRRAKPAVPLGSKFRLIDVPISNCINSGLNRIYILTQFNSTPLHRHISRSYDFHSFSPGFVEILAAQQTPDLGPVDATWYQGTADAVRKNLPRFRDAKGREVLILSGDQIYQMNFQEILTTHRGHDDEPVADVTIGAVVVTREWARSLGVLRIDDAGTVRAFVEKPGNDDSRFEGLEISPRMAEKFELPSRSDGWYLANMGIYVFNVDRLAEALDSEYKDFGKEVLPSLLGNMRVRAHLFHGYWEDIGTIRAFHEANLELARPNPRFNFFQQDAPIYTRARLLPASRIRRAMVSDSLISDGCLVDEAEIETSLVGIRSVVNRNCRLLRTYVMGADYYEGDEERAANRRRGIPDLGIGEDCVIENAIIDKNARVGRSVRITNSEGRQEHDDGVVVVRGGIAVVPRDGVVPDNYTL